MGNFFPRIYFAVAKGSLLRLSIAALGGSERTHYDHCGEFITDGVGGGGTGFMLIGRLKLGLFAMLPPHHTLFLQSQP
jgi:hypothetical protein